MELVQPQTPQPLLPTQARRTLDPSSLPFETTADLAPSDEIIWQPRAREALEFGAQVDSYGFNIYVAGQEGSGREEMVRRRIEECAKLQPKPDDWLYVYNFHDADKPKAIRVAAGKGKQLQQDMLDFVQSARRNIPKFLESEDFARRLSEAMSPIREERSRLLSELEKYASERNFRVKITPTVIVSQAIVDGRTLTTKEFEELEPDAKARIESASQEVEKRIEATVRALRQVDKKEAEKIKDVTHDLINVTIGPLLAELSEKYKDNSSLGEYFRAVEADIHENLSAFHVAGDANTIITDARLLPPELARYTVNLVVDNSELQGAPVVFERDPTYYNLVGRTNYRATMAAMMTDFREIKAGALQRANGGYLVLRVLDLFQNPFSWKALKDSLRQGEIRIENLGEQLTMVPIKTVLPEPIPLSVKVILIGHPHIYQLLLQMDEDFRELFKIKAHFNFEMDWNHGAEMSLSRLISWFVRDKSLLHLDRGAVAKVIEYGGRLNGSQKKITARVREIFDLVVEANAYAKKEKSSVIQQNHVRRAIQSSKFRSNLAEEKLREMLDRNVLLIQCDGARVGQLNGISVIDLGDYHFGHPVRISASVGRGLEGVRSIERDTKMSGRIHSKGFLTLLGFLNQKYGEHTPLVFRASVSFEQTYDEVEGDSASSAELYALVSALSNLELNQGIAVTGSVNQMGDVQPVGGVTQKIEGFFAACKIKGLTGRQGVIIPEANVQDLMLDDEVVEAISRGQFHIWPIRSIDEGLTLLTGRAAGERNANGEFPEGSVHQLVEARLGQMAGEWKKMAQPQMLSAA